MPTQIVKRFTLFSRLCVLLSLGAAVPARAVDVAALTAQVNALPATTPAEQLKKTDLQWVLEDAKNNTDYYNADTTAHAWAGTQASSEYQDISNALPDNTIGVYVTPPANVYPAIPYLTAGSNHNIVFDAAETKFTATLVNSAYMNTIPSKYATTGTISTGVPTVDNNAIAAAAIFELGHPQSDFRPGGSKFTAAAIVPVLRQLQNAADTTNNTANFGNFGWSAALAEKYLDVISAFPHLLLPTQVSTITTAIKKNAASINNGNGTFTQRMQAVALGTLFMNADVKDITALAYADYLFPELHNQYAGIVSNGVGFMKNSLFPDGASPYYDRHNEAYSYHGIYISEMGRYAQITGDTNGLDIIRESAGYYPLSLEPGTLTNFNAVT